MEFTTVLFYIFALLLVVSGLKVITSRNPVASALFLVLAFFNAAAIWMLLQAEFLAILLVLVYVGAVMVLFLFIIMLLDLKAEERRKFNGPALAGGALITLSFVGLLVKVLGQLPDGGKPFPVLTGSVQDWDDVRKVGLMLFTNYNLPFQAIGVLILVATIGVVVLSKKELK